MCRYAAIIACFFISVTSHAQTYYKIDWPKEREIVTASALMGGSSLLLDATLPQLNLSDINSLSISDINRFDRPATLYYSSSADLLSDVFISVNSFAPLGLLLLENVNSEKGAFMLMYGETFLLNAGVTFLVKAVTQRPRPYTYNPLVPITEKLRAKSKRSFFSGHVSQSTALSFFGAKVFSDLYPESKYKAIVWTAAATLPMVTAYGRYKAGQHFPSDIAGGYIVGGMIGILVPLLHTRIGPISRKLNVNTNGHSIGIVLKLN